MIESLTLTAILSSLASVIAAISSIGVAMIEISRKLKDARKVSLEQVIESNDIQQFGKFLDNTIGQFDVAEYVDSAHVTETIDHYFDGVIKYLGTSESAEQEERVTEVDVTHPLGLPKLSQISEQLRPVVSELEGGQIWNALARLRMILEVTLRERALSHGFKERHLRSAGQILHILAERRYLAPNIEKPLRYAVAICNRAVHGREVSMSEAEEAFWIIERALGDMLASTEENS